MNLLPPSSWQEMQSVDPSVFTRLHDVTSKKTVNVQNSLVVLHLKFARWKHTGRVEAWLHTFLNSALDGGEWLTSRPDHLTPKNYHSTNWIEGWLDRIAGLDVSEKTKISYTQRDSNPGSSSPYLLGYPVPSSLVALQIKIPNVTV